MEIPAQRVMERIAAIEERISVISGGDDSTSAAPAAQSGSGGFAGALESARQGYGAAQAPLIGPDGTAVRPLIPVMTSAGAATGTTAFADDIAAAAAKYNIDPKLVRAVMQVESGGNPQAISRAGAMGLMQLMPGNASAAGLTNPFDPAGNIDAGAHQLANLLSEFGGDLDKALAGYNAGPNAVRRYGGIPPYAETQNYVRRVRSLMEQP